MGRSSTAVVSSSWTIASTLFQAAIGYKDGTRRPIDASVSFGQFGGNQTRLYSVTTSRPIGTCRSGSNTTAPSSAHSRPARSTRNGCGASRSAPLGPDANLSFSLRSINGALAPAALFWARRATPTC
jgi:hypothetical protein